MAKNTGIIDFFETLIAQSGFRDYLVAAPGALEKIAKLNRFFDEVNNLAQQKRDAKIGDLLRYIEILKSYNLMVKAPIQNNAGRCVELMTAHKSKGLEFEYVYLTGGYDTHWGNKRNSKLFDVPMLGAKVQSFDPIEDERRLFYVALTRAKKQVLISYSRIGLDGREQLPSQFIQEIDPVLVEVQSVDELEQLFVKQRGVFVEKVNHGISFEDKEYLRGLFLQQGLSATALNQYLKCPWDYFFHNLLRLPTAKSKFQLYGTAIHNTLKDFFDKYSREEDMTLEMLLITFEYYLKRQPLIQQDFNETLEKGRAALEGYYKAYYPSWSRRLFTEFKIPAVFYHIEINGKQENIILSGQLDKIELQDNNDVKVVDYKTGKPKTHNEIMGKTKNSDGDYYRQLLFYKILLDSYEDGKYRMIAGEIDFIESDSKDTFKKEYFEMNNEDIAEVKKTITRVAQEIYDFTFWDSTCENDCEFCRLRQLVKDREAKQLKRSTVSTAVSADLSKNNP